jgi:ubiquinone/menaquinone biosynthesis C-methylase UbiE
MRIADNIENEFNAFSSNYTNDMINSVPHYLDLIDAFVKDLPKSFDPDRILDLGCGNGNVSAKVMNMYPKSHLVLLDASQDMLDLCERQFRNFTIELVKSYFQDYSFQMESYDMINAGFSIHHCSAEEKKDLFKKIYGSLQKGGVFGYSDLMVDKKRPYHKILLKEWHAFVRNNYEDDSHWEWLMEHYDEFDHPNDHEEQIGWLNRSGFKDIQYIFREDCWVHIRCIK